MTCTHRIDILKGLDADVGKAAMLKKAAFGWAKEAQLELDALNKQVDRAWCKARNTAVGTIKTVQKTLQVGLDLDDVDPCFKPDPPLKAPIAAAVLEDEPIYEIKKTESNQ